MQQQQQQQQQQQPITDREPQQQVQGGSTSDLQDLLDLHQDGELVQWPEGMNAKKAASVLAGASMPPKPQEQRQQSLTRKHEQSCIPAKRQKRPPIAEFLNAREMADSEPVDFWASDSSRVELHTSSQNQEQPSVYRGGGIWQVCFPGEPQHPPQEFPPNMQLQVRRRITGKRSALQEQEHPKPKHCKPG